ncbi:hypothetical protein [Roseomonas indoligenes]|uniref:Uncharacterized protein n=1 Tax=Roseomonas indoligenes TaxID=2820811 RepID=A0A940MVN0_9PROT|nr:hypothetical protein [Pararoseomonas indoligenes]MBP0491619.1 hypothetical protein [Pararoseomonas indoligenes]
MDPDQIGAAPPEDLAVLLEWRDRRPWILDLPRPRPMVPGMSSKVSDAGEVLFQALESEETQVLGGAGLQQHVEWASLTGGNVLQPDPVMAVLRRTANGLAYLIQASRLAAETYSSASRPIRELPPDRVLFIKLCAAFERAFGRDAAIGNNAATGERDGPTIRFCHVDRRGIGTLLEG